MAIIISGFPSSLPGAKERREKTIREGHLNKKSERKEAKLKEILPELKSLLLNWTLLFNSLGISVVLIFVGAFIPFLGKIVQLKFGLDPVRNGYLLSAVMTPTIMSRYTIYCRYLYIHAPCFLRVVAYSCIPCRIQFFTYQFGYYSLYYHYSYYYTMQNYNELNSLLVLV